MRIKGVISIILIMFLLTGTWGCSVSEDINEKAKDDVEKSIEYEPAFGGEINLPIDNVVTLNPLLNEDLSLYYFNKLIFEGLFTIDKDLNVKSQLSKGYNINEDGRKVSIELREDVKWHDGENFTSEDVKFTIDVIKYATNEGIYKDFLNKVYKPVSPNDLIHILDVNIIDEYNLEVVFDRSYSNALEGLTFPIIPKHRFFKENSTNRDAYNKALVLEDYKPIGTGPYKFVDYENLKAVKLTANKEWWDKTPYIEKITGKVIKGEALQVTSFESKQVDVAIAKGPDWGKYSQKEDIDIYEYPSQNYVFLGFNFGKEVFQGDKGRAIRQAIAYGIDKKSIIDKVYLGHGKVTDTPIAPYSWLSSGDLKYEYNMEKAKETLEDADFKDSDNNGIYEDNEGNELTLKILTNSNNLLRRETANLIVENLEAMGIKVIKDYQEQNPEDITEEISDKEWNQVIEKVNTGDFDMVLLQWQLSHIPDLSFAFHSSMIGGSNIIFYSNETMDSLIEDAFSATSRQNKANAYKKLDSFIATELPYVSLYYKNQGLLLNSKIKGEIRPNSFNVYNNINNWFIPEELQNKPKDEEEVK